MSLLIKPNRHMPNGLQWKDVKRLIDSLPDMENLIRDLSAWAPQMYSPELFVVEAQELVDRATSIVADLERLP